jgi:hypothetical protein
MGAKLARNSSVAILIQRPMIKRNLTGIVEDSGKPAIPAGLLEPRYVAVGLRQLQAGSVRPGILTN